MKNIYLNIHKANSFSLKKAKKIVENNNLVGLPTETVYGLAGNAYSNEAVKKISINYNFSYLVIAKITMLNNEYTIIKDTLFQDFKKIK